MRHVSARRRAAAAELLRVTVAMAHLQARKAKIVARIAAIDAEEHRANTTGHTQATLEHRRDAAVSAMRNLDVRIKAEQRALSSAEAAWGGGKVKKKGVTADLLKAESIPKPGQRYRHGWIPIDADMHDTVGLGSARAQKWPNHTFHASHRVEGTHGAPVTMHIANWSNGNESEPPEIGVETNPHDDITPSAANLDAKGARQAADHLRDLATIAESGEKPTVTKPTKHSRTAARIQDVIDNKPWMGITRGSKLDIDGNDLPLTYGDLLDLLAPHIPAQTVDEKRLRRVVKEKRGIDFDPSDLHMHLDTTGDQPIIHITARERNEDPWDPTSEDDFEQRHMSHLTPAAARELAAKLDEYAKALPKEAR
jgi:hypothetical protein